MTQSPMLELAARQTKVRTTTSLFEACYWLINDSLLEEKHNQEVKAKKRAWKEPCYHIRLITSGRIILHHLANEVCVPFLRPKLCPHFMSNQLRMKNETPIWQLFIKDFGRIFHAKQRKGEATSPRTLLAQPCSFFSCKTRVLLLSVHLSSSKR